MAEKKWSRGVEIREGALGGWHEDQSAEVRHAKLRKAIRRDGAGEISRRLNFLSNVANRSNNPKLHRVARVDQGWVQRTFESNVRRE